MTDRTVEIVGRFAGLQTTSEGARESENRGEKHAPRPRTVRGAVFQARSGGRAVHEQEARLGLLGSAYSWFPTLRATTPHQNPKRAPNRPPSAAALRAPKRNHRNSTQSAEPISRTSDHPPTLSLSGSTVLSSSGSVLL